MNFSNLKESLLRKKFDQLVLKSNKNKLVSQKEIQSVGILTLAKTTNAANIQSHVETILGVRNTKIYSFKKFDKTDEVSFKHFTEKDMNWKGDFTQTNFQSFLEQPLDLLIGYFNKEHLHLEKAVYASKAKFKVGFSEVNSNLYEIEIQTAIENSEEFCVELKKYLKILKKLKN